MKLFIAGLDTETNTFAPIPTGQRAFADGFVAHGDATRQPENYCSAQLKVWRRRAEERGWMVAESLCAFAEPGGTVVRGVYEILPRGNPCRPSSRTARRHGHPGAAWCDGGRGVR